MHHSSKARIYELLTFVTRCLLIFQLVGLFKYVSTSTLETNKLLIQSAIAAFLWTLGDILSTRAALFNFHKKVPSRTPQPLP